MTRRTTRRLPARDPQVAPRAVIVTRMSKDDGDNVVNHETQATVCRRKAAAVGAVVAAELRDDRSGDRLDRDGLSCALDMIRAGEAELLITYATDRLSRNQTQQAVILYQVRRAGGEVLSATEDLAAGPLGDFMRAAYGFAAEMELFKVRERVNRHFGATFAGARRYKPGGRVLYGYAKTGQGAEATYGPHPTEAAVVRRIYADAARGRSRTKITADLNAEGVSSPSNVRWHASVVTTILGRAVYHTGEHGCWRTRTARDADNVPFKEERPAAERYLATDQFVPLVDAATAAQARTAAGRNVWRSRRADRPAEEGIFRYGFALCGGCRRALSVTEENGQTRYKCTAPSRGDFRCPAPTSINLPKLDGPVWAWVEDAITMAERSRFLVVPERTAPDPATLAALAAAESEAGALQAQAEGLLANLALLTGAAAKLAAAKINALNAASEAAVRERDRLAAEVVRATAAPARTVPPERTLERAAYAAIAAMRDADPAPVATRTITFNDPAGAQAVTVPDSWTAKQAALSVLGAEVVVNRRGTEPRWEATLRVPGGGTVSGEAGIGGRPADGGFYLTETRGSAAA